MDNDWEQTFREWSKPSSDTEQQKCDNAISMVNDAIKVSPLLEKRNIEVFAQGSYQNNTNVRLESDVDICVRCMDVIFTDFSMAEGFKEEDLGLQDSTYSYTQFKNEVEAALVSKFGRNEVKRGNKAFHINENTYHVDADVVPCFEHRRYTTQRTDGSYIYLSGAEFRPDRGGRIINWPLQNYENGVGKNGATGGRFKRNTRVLKRLRNEMEDSGIEVAKPIPSYLIECLMWNVTNEGFGHDEYIADVRYALAHTFNNTMIDEQCKEWGEVNELKYLFRSSHPWTREQANKFLDAAWVYIGFE